MADLNEKIVIVGSGAAAVAAIKAIRKFDSRSEISVFGAEKFFPYYRIKLSKGLLGGLQEEKILLQKKEWYDANNIQLFLDKKVSGIIPEEKNIILEDGSSIPYTKLLLVNGASNFTPPIAGIDKTGVFAIRFLEDALKITEYLKDSQSIILIGGGIQNLEVANVLSKSGRKVTVIEFASRLMPRQLDEKAAEILKKAAETQGIDILLGAQVAEISGKEKVEKVITQTGIEIPCEMVLYSTGIRPNIQIVANTSIESNFGIKVDRKMETSESNVFAAGDIAEVDGRVYGLWNIAMQQGEIAGMNICGREALFEHAVPVTSLDAFGTFLFSMGEIEVKSDTQLFTKVDDMNQKYYKVLVLNNQVVGAIVLGDMKNAMALKSAIEKKSNIYYHEKVGHSLEELLELIKK